MYNAILLASVLATPPENHGREEFERYLDRLLDWSPLMETGLTRPLCSYTTLNALFESGAYPLTPHIRSMIDRFGLREFSVQDIATVSDFLLARSMKIEDASGIKEILHSYIECLPAPHSADEHPALRENSSYVLALLAAWIGATGGDGKANICICSCHDAPGHIRIRATIDDIDMAGPREAFAPFSTQAIVRAASDLPSTLLCMSEILAWQNSQTQEQACLAVRLALYKASRRLNQPISWDATPSPIVRQELLESAMHLGFMHEPSKIGRLLSAMTDALAGRNLQSTHALRTARGGNAPQVRRGDAKAFRWDIDNEFHLHYWQLASGGIEFAKIVVHNDFTIPT